MSRLVRLTLCEHYSFRLPYIDQCSRSTMRSYGPERKWQDYSSKCSSIQRCSSRCEGRRVYLSKWLPAVNQRFSGSELSRGTRRRSHRLFDCIGNDAVCGSSCSQEVRWSSLVIFLSANFFAVHLPRQNVFNGSNLLLTHSA